MYHKCTSLSEFLKRNHLASYDNNGVLDGGVAGGNNG